MSSSSKKGEREVILTKKEFELLQYFVGREFEAVKIFGPEKGKVREDVESLVSKLS